MALWLVRAGKHGEFERIFLEDGRIYLNWGEIDEDLSQYSEKELLRDYLEQVMPEASPDRVSNAMGQMWAFMSRMEVGDWVVLPSKLSSTLHFAEIIGDYRFKPSEGRPGQWRPVKWIATDIPRSTFNQDLLYSFGAFLTVCRISRNDAEKRVREMAENNWQETTPNLLVSDEADIE